MVVAMTNTQFLLWLAILGGLIPMIPVLVHLRKAPSAAPWIRGIPPLLLSMFSMGVLGLFSGGASRDTALILLGGMIAVSTLGCMSAGVRALKFLKVQGGWLAFITLPVFLVMTGAILLSYLELQTGGESHRSDRERRGTETAARIQSTTRFIAFQDELTGYEFRPGSNWFQDPATLADLPKMDSAAVRGEVGLVTSSVVFPESCPPDPQVLRVLLFNEELTYPEDSIRQVSSSTHGVFRHLILQSRQVGTEGPITNLHHMFIGENVAVCITAYAGEGVRDLKTVSEEITRMFTPGPARVRPDPTRWSNELQRKQALRLNQVALDYYEREHYETSLKWCRAALAQSQDPPPVLLSNSLLILNEMNRHQEALDWLRTYATDLNALPPELQAWYAWHLFEAGEREKGLEQYNALFESGHRDHAELTAYMSLLLEHYGSPEQAMAARKAYATESGNRALLLESARRFRSAGHPKHALEELVLLEQQDSGTLLDATLTLEKLYAFNDLDRQEEALALADLLEKEGHVDANLHYHRAQSLFGLKRYPEAKQALEAALTLSPGNTMVLEDLRMVAGMMGQGENSAVRIVLEPLPLPEDLPASPHPLAEGTEFAPGGEVVSNIRLMSKVTPRKLKQTTYRRIHITDRGAANEFRTLSLDFNPLSERIYVNSLKVLNSDGSLRAEVDRETFYVMDEEDRTLVTFDKTLQIPVPQLKPGTFLELVYTRETTVEEGDIPFETIYFARFTPIRFFALVWVGEIEKLKYNQYQLEDPLHLENGLAWIAQNIPAYRWEALQGEATEFLPTVVLGSQTTTWEEEASGYITEKLNSRLVSSDRTRELATKLTVGLQTPTEKVEAIAGYVQRHCQYQGIEFGVRGRLPNFPDAILSRTFGDCKDHTVLLVQLLREAGFQAWPALVSTEARVFPEYASLDQFDHMIACVELEGEKVFLDATLKSGPLLNLPPVPNGSPHALVLHPERPRLESIPRANERHNQVEVTTHLRMDAHRLKVTEVCTLTGLAASHFRAPLHEVNPEDRIQWFHQHILPAHLQVQNLEVAVKHLDAPDRPLELTLTYQRRVPGKGQSLPASIWDGFYLRPTVIPDRRTPFRVRNPFQYKRVASWEPGDPLESNRKKRQSESHRFQTWDLSIGNPETAGQKLVVTIPRFEAASKEYGQYQQLREDILDAAHLRIRSE